ncbi:Serine protease inhibitor [Dirofilaria immitis]|nr:Serine protease inhibitor [Dirofilaria immitis]
MTIAKECKTDECEKRWPGAICRGGRCACPQDSIRRKSDSNGWICLSLVDASTGMLGPPYTCPLRMVLDTGQYCIVMMDRYFVIHPMRIVVRMAMNAYNRLVLAIVNKTVSVVLEKKQLAFNQFVNHKTDGIFGGILMVKHVNHFDGIRKLKQLPIILSPENIVYPIVHDSYSIIKIKAIFM